jgi:plasmid stability protein
MPVSLSVKAVPQALAAALRRRARRNHRSLQGELLAILHDAVATDQVRTSRAPEAREVATGEWTPLPGASIAPRSESALIIRAAREGRTRTVGQLFDELAAMGAGTPSESAAIIRKIRSSR